MLKELVRFITKDLLMELSSIFLWVKVRKILLSRLSRQLVKLVTGLCSRMCISCRPG